MTMPARAARQVTVRMTRTARRAESGGGLAQRVGHQQQHVLRRAHDDGNDDHGQREPTPAQAEKVPHPASDEQIS